MAELKTRPTKGSVEQFLKQIEDEGRRRDCRKVLQIMKRITKSKPTMWGPSMVGFGRYQYKYATGREGEWFKTGVAPRAQSLVLYIMPGFDGYPELMAKLGKHKTGRSCLYINKLEDVHLPTLRTLIRKSVAKKNTSS